jgi:hypothetical protein
MKSCRKMQAIITELAQQHKMDLSAPQSHLRLEKGLYQPLVIEKIGLRQISVAHYREQNGDLLQDPEIVFFITETGWYPLEITQVFPGWKQIATVDEEKNQIVRAKLRLMESVAEFAEMWADNLRDQGWLEITAKHQMQEPA